MDMELLMARARLNHLAKISPVGTPTQFNGSVSSGGSASIPIPSASQAGDVLLIVGQISTAQSSITVTPPAGSTTVIAPTFYASNVSPAQSYFGLAYLYPLTATDITNGSVSVSATGASTLFFDIAALALRGAGTLLDGAIGQVIQASQQTLPVNITVPGVTTSVVNDFLVYLVAVTTGDPSEASSPYVFSTPIGWSKAIDTYRTGYSPVSTGYLNQTSAGFIGSAAVNFSRSDSLNDASAFAGWMFAIRAKAPAITLSATFPTSPHVGDTVSFDVTATLVDGATGTLTIEVDQLPDGLTFGSTSMVDATHYKATVSGTLTTVQDVTSTFSATGGSVSATSLVHEFDVTAAASPPVPMQAVAIHSSTKAASIGSADGWATPAAGSLLLIGLVRSSSGVVKPSGWNDAEVSLPGTNRNIVWYWKKALGTESTVSFQAFGAVLLEIVGADTTNPIHDSGAQAISGKPANFPSLTPTIPNTLAIGAATWNATVDGTGATASAGWDVAAAVDSAVTFNPFAATQGQDDSLATVTGSITPATGSMPDGVATLLLIKPAG